MNPAVPWLSLSAFAFQIPPLIKIETESSRIAKGHSLLTRTYHQSQGPYINTAVDKYPERLGYRYPYVLDVGYFLK